MPTLLPQIDPGSATAMSEQIARFYERAIDDGQVMVGDRLPPIREVATGCQVTRATVQDAYRRLANRGLVEGTVGRGTVVLRSPSASEDSAQGGGRLLSPYAEAALRRARSMAGAPTLPVGQQLVANFAELQPDDAQFPIAEWRGAMDKVLAENGRDLLGYGHSIFGLQDLRDLLAGRSKQCDPGLSGDEVLVTAGAQQALDLVLRTVCSHGDTVLVAQPSYHHMHGLMRAHGLQVVQVPFGPDGLDVAQLRRAMSRPSVRMCYLMPSFQNPTGRSLDLAQREELIDSVRETDVVLVEDEYQHSLRFRGEALPTLRSMDPRGRTLTVSTVSKDLFPALRIGWIAGVPQLLEPMAAVKRFMDLETSPLLQAALVEFMRQGSFDRHLEQLRVGLLERHRALQEASAAHLPEGCSVTDPDGGFVAWLELPDPGQGEQLAELAVERGVRVVPGRAFDLDGAPSRGVRLSLTRASVPQIHEGVRVLGECARELLQLQATAQPFL